MIYLVSLDCKFSFAKYMQYDATLGFTRFVIWLSVAEW